MATDVLVNFVQRWLKQAPNHKAELLPLPQVLLACLLHLDCWEAGCPQTANAAQCHCLNPTCVAQIPHIVAPENQVRGPGDPAAFAIDPADPEAWRAQIFRSIDSDSAEGMPTGSEASALGLDSGKGKVLEPKAPTAAVHVPCPLLGLCSSEDLHRRFVQVVADTVAHPAYHGSLPK